MSDVQVCISLLAGLFQLNQTVRSTPTVNNYSETTCMLQFMSRLLLLPPLSTHSTLTQDVCHTVGATLDLVKNRMQLSGKPSKL